MLPAAGSQRSGHIFADAGWSGAGWKQDRSVGITSVSTLYVLRGPSKGRTYQLLNGTAVLGRYSDEIPLNDQTISRQHARLQQTNGHWELTDLGSSNGTYLNGTRVSGSVEVKHGDQIKIGSTLMVFSGHAAVGLPDSGSSARDLVDVGPPQGLVDTSILSAMQSCDDSAILAAPETADAVRAWNVMYRLAEAVGSIASAVDFLERVADVLLDHLVVDRVFILLRNESTGALDPVVVRFYGAAGGRQEKILTSRTVINHVIETRSGVLCANATADERFGRIGAAASLHSLGLRSVICVPIMAHDQVGGIIHLDCAMSRHTFSHDQLRLAIAVGRMCGLALENLRLLEQRMHQERLAATGETVAYLSHHIRNILQGLRSGADVVELGLRKNHKPNIQAGWTIVQHNLDRIFRLTLNMLTFSKDREPRLETVQINGIVEDVLTLAQRQAEASGVNIQRRLTDIPAVPVDPDGLHQAVFNIVINAIAACPAKGGEVVIGTAHDITADEVIVEIGDNGSGIPPEGLPHLFRPFHSSKGQGGTGLGLAAARKIMDELHGRIDVQSKRDEGTTFRLCLPTRQPRPADVEKTHVPSD
jgi:two-component system, NtrC family, sensor kinase